LTRGDRVERIGQRIVLVGVGGQGILFATQVLLEAARSVDYDVMASETHGMSQRGGSVISHLKFGPYESPLVRRGTADLAISMHPIETYLALPFLRSKGQCLVNTPESDFMDGRVARHLARGGIKVLSFDADKVAMTLGSASVANMALLGYGAAKRLFPFDCQSIKDAVGFLSPKRFEAINLQALETGYRGAM
jgi:indolepyruvate ferredoxin oxidoreductase beta subunit